MNLKLVQQLRKKTGVGILECQNALKQSNGNIDKATEILRKKGKKIVESKRGRDVKEGIIEAYIHSNAKIGVLVELVCETDFVARNKEFKELAHNLAMQIAATDPKWIRQEDIPKQTLDKEKEIIKESLLKQKSNKVGEKIIQGKLKKFYTETCLLNQVFIKDEKIIIKELIQEKIARLGENIQIKKFIRFAL